MTTVANGNVSVRAQGAADDAVIIAIFNDGDPDWVARTAAALPHRTKSALQQRASSLRKLGLITGGRKFYTKIEPVPSPRQQSGAVDEHPIRCPGCRKVFFPSDSLPIRAEAD